MDLRHLSFRLLEVFMCVVQTGSVSETARRLHLTQPTVSLQIKRLTEAVGEQLFYTQHQRLMTTEAGLELFRTCLQVFEQFDDYQRYLKEIQGGERGHCRIAMVNTAQYILPKLLGPFSLVHPNVDMKVEIGNREQVLARFERAEDDLYVFSHPPSLEHALAGRFLQNPLVLLAPADHPLAALSQVSLSDIVQHRFLLREPGSATRMLFDSALQSRGLVLADSIQMASNEAIRVAVSAGMGIAVLSRHVIPAHDTTLKIIPIKGLELASHWYFIVRTDRHIAHAAKHFLRFAQMNLENYLDKTWVRNGLNELNQALSK
ncbi:LysR family transcriptional regulator [Pseudoalteromonas xiamenensis]|uniref:LysR family transcriptional regulator n=1 Tax=Pseudoalteromonas xiamenensis TaxID=882626 RepID=UPI0027E44CB9|nr:LysR family transcriptional regulator [Pseudoalteromonas xiamenensis]WMN61079.1 LysR family transcriptional regulator [Pseudoalteromonas xiamenensis]